MKHKLTLFAVAFVVLCVLITAPSHAAGSKGTVITKSGEKYESVSYVIDNAYKLVTVTVGGEKKNISFTQIQAIINEKGVNVAADLLKGYYKPTPQSPADRSGTEQPPADTANGKAGPAGPTELSVPDATLPESKQSQETWLSQTEPAYKEAHKRLWRRAFMLGANFSMPSGDYYYGAESGIGFGGAVRIPVGRDVAIRIDISRAGFGYEDEFAIVDVNTGDSGTAHYDLTTMRYTLSAVLHKLMYQDKRNLNMFYVSVGLGMTDHKWKAAITTYDGSDHPHSRSAERRQRNLAAVFGGGIVIMVSENIGVDLGADWHVTFVGKGQPSRNILPAVNFEYAQNIDVKLGVMTLF